MLLSKAKQIFEMKVRTAGGLKPPENDELSELFYEAMISIATRCIPRELLNSSIASDTSILRFIGGGDIIALPEYPDFTSTELHLQIDEDLTYAVINKAVALYCRDAKDIVKFENEAHNIINRYKANFSKILGRAV